MKNQDQYSGNEVGVELSELQWDHWAVYKSPQDHV